ncbi:uncharacterized protein LOC124180674 [Neodiprion fabricii]|uniref:uncharacterized protein LOC124180674 n=1 Tax=Neodiprion fabricii TaxID=2872261 RepID=UPI001ED90E03|nr:uncharacterized protein LOC124180674 [Neodiprion fabricii]
MARHADANPYLRCNIVNNDSSEEISLNNGNVVASILPNDSSPYEPQSSVTWNNLAHEAKDNSSEYGCSNSDAICEDDSNSQSMGEEGSTRLKNYFRTQLADCFIENNIDNVQANSILTVLRSHCCLASRPEDVRILIGTCNRRVELIDVEPGKYWHGKPKDPNNFFKMFINEIQEMLHS